MLGGFSAAAFWEMRPVWTGDVDVLVVGHVHGRSRQGIRIHRTGALHRADLRLREGLSLTSPARTLIDIAPELSARELERTLNEAIIRRLLTRDAVLKALNRASPKRGCARVRELCATHTLTRSQGERQLLALIRKAQLHRPETNARFERFEVDFLWRKERVAVELDGYDFHSTRAALERDHAKDMTLQTAGFVVIRITGRQLAREPEMVLALIAGALARSQLAAA